MDAGPSAGAAGMLFVPTVRSPPVRQRRVLLGLALLVVVALLLPLGCGGPLRADTLRRATGQPVVDEHLELARSHAPWVLHAVHDTRGRQDIPAPLGFDGDFDGENDWDTFVEVELLPTLSYAVLQTETHWFLTYHLFHPRDWSFVELGVHTTHEGDGENLQVVVRKRDGRVEALMCQAHYRGRLHVVPGRGWADGDEESVSAPVLVDDAGRLDPEGRHPAVFVEWGGHGIYAVGDPCAEATLEPGEGAARAVFDGAGVVLRPARADEVVGEPDLPTSEAWPYQLESTLAKVWPGVRSGELVGEGRLLDGCVDYADDRVTLRLPRYHEADRFSGPFGPDRGISPFAVDVDFDEPHLGALFFDPARRWPELLQVPDDWSTTYVDDPFAP